VDREECRTRVECENAEPCASEDYISWACEPVDILRMMESAVEKRFERIESLLDAMAERENQMELRFNRRMDRAEQRMDRAEQRMDRADERMEKFDRRLEATRKLVEAGMKMVLQIGQQQKQIGQQQKVNEIELRRLERSVESFVNSMKRGGNGSQHS